MSSKFGPILSRTTELPALEHLINRYCHFFYAFFHPTLFILTCNDDMHDSTGEFEFGKIRPPTVELAALDVWKNPQRLIMGKRCCHFFSGVLGQNFFILAGNDDIHKSLDEFETRPDPTTDNRVSCP